MYRGVAVGLLLVCSWMAGCVTADKGDNETNCINEFDVTCHIRKEMYMANGRMVTVGDSLLLVVSHSAPGICTLFRTDENLSEAAAYGTIGNGPGEFVQPLLTYACGNTFGLNEVGRQELVEMEVCQQQEIVNIRERQRLKAVGRPRSTDEWIPSDYYYVRLDGAHFVSLTGVKNGSFFTLSDSMLVPIEHFGDSPIEEELPAVSARNRLNGKLMAENGAMVYATTKLPYLAYYRLCSGKMVKQWSLFYAPTDYGVRNGDLLFSREKAMGPMLDAEMDADYIYVLFMDQPLGLYDYSSARQSTSNKILVFDHDGRQVASLHLDVGIQEMTVLRDRLKLYGIAKEPDISLVGFDLPSELFER